MTRHSILVNKKLKKVALVTVDGADCGSAALLKEFGIRKA